LLFAYEKEQQQQQQRFRKKGRIRRINRRKGGMKFMRLGFMLLLFQNKKYV
jgi:hypothetical protein